MTSTRGLSQTELLLRTMWEGGLDPIDRNGVPRVPLGSGPYSQRVRGIYPIKERRPRSLSRFLTNRDFLRLYKAVAVANLEGWLLNTFVTVSWKLAGVTHPASVRAHEKGLQERLNKWFAYRREADPGYPPAAGVWVKEVGQSLGLHMHYLLHVPCSDAREFARWMRKSVAKATGSSLGTVGRSKRGHPLIVTQVDDLRGSYERQWAVFRYMAKGLDPDQLTAPFTASRRRMLADEYTGVADLSDQGTVEGQRCGRSQAISAAAFAAWRAVYDEIMEDQWRSAGRRSFHYGRNFLGTGDFLRLIERADI